MNFRVVFAPEAIEDLAAIHDYIAPRASNRIARRYVSGIFQYCMAFETFPERGAKRDDLRLGLRVVGYRRKASIAFQVKGEEIVILRVLNKGQNVDKEWQ